MSRGAQWRRNLIDAIPHMADDGSAGAGRPHPSFDANSADANLMLPSWRDRGFLRPLALVAGPKHDELSTGVLVIGADGYRALISYGEMAPGLGERAVLLATTEDGRPLARPRLVVPGDVKGGRFVTDVVELRVLRP